MNEENIKASEPETVIPNLTEEEIKKLKKITDIPDVIEERKN
ncbi:hypothetical protein [Belliella calami]|nr:hypothetical protein [Belliella calami]